jgi:hypothetical protein
LDNARPHLTEHEIQTNNFTQLFHPARTPDLTPTDFRLFGYLEVMLEWSSFQTGEELQEKVTDDLMSIQASTFRTVFEEWKSRLL